MHIATYALNYHVILGHLEVTHYRGVGDHFHSGWTIGLGTPIEEDLMTDLGDFDLASTDEGIDRASDPAAIGALTVVEGLQLSEESGGDRIEAYITPEYRDEVRLRSYVVVPLTTPPGDPPGHLFCRIERVRYGHEFATDDATAIHARRAMDRDGIDENDYKFIASLRPLATVSGDPRDPDALLGRRAPDLLPKPESIVREAVYDTEIKTGLKLPREGLFVGHLAVGGERVMTAAEPPTVDYRLRDAVDEPLIFRHMLIAGGTGSGKTHAAKNVLRQLVDDDRRYRLANRTVQPSLIIIDPQDEYAQLNEDNPTVDVDTEQRWARESIANGGVQSTTVFVPDVAGTSYAPTNHRAEQLRFTLPFELVQRYPWLIAGARMNEIQYNALRDLVQGYFNTGSTDASYGGFIEHLEEGSVRESAIESGRVHESTFEAIYRRVDRPIFHATFDQGAKPITELIDQFVTPGGIATVPTYHLEDAVQRRLLVLAVASLVVDEKLTSEPRYRRIKETPIVLAMDEAHNYLADVETVIADRTVRKFTEAAKQGRKERLGLCLITQDPGDVADPIRTQINTKIALNLTDDDAIASLNLDRHLERQVPDLERGQMVVHSPDNAEAVQVIGLNRCVVKHVPR